MPENNCFQHLLTTIKQIDGTQFVIKAGQGSGKLPPFWVFSVKSGHFFIRPFWNTTQNGVERRFHPLFSRFAGSVNIKAVIRSRYARHSKESPQRLLR